jgi:hypothetical protein
MIEKACKNWADAKPFPPVRVNRHWGKLLPERLLIALRLGNEWCCEEVAIEIRRLKNR